MPFIYSTLIFSFGINSNNFYLNSGGGAIFYKTFTQTVKRTGSKAALFHELSWQSMQLLMPL